MSDRTRTRTITHRRGPENIARDIANAAYADITGTRHRTPTHRKEN